jgi:hypothetical protein
MFGCGRFQNKMIVLHQIAWALRTDELMPCGAMALILKSVLLERWGTRIQDPMGQTDFVMERKKGPRNLRGPWFEARGSSRIHERFTELISNIQSTNMSRERDIDRVEYAS